MTIAHPLQLFDPNPKRLWRLVAPRLERALCYVESKSFDHSVWRAANSFHFIGPDRLATSKEIVDMIFLPLVRIDRAEPRNSGRAVIAIAQC